LYSGWGSQSFRSSFGYKSKRLCSSGSASKLDGSGGGLLLSNSVSDGVPDYESPDRVSPAGESLGGGLVRGVPLEGGLVGGVSLTGRLVGAVSLVGGSVRGISSEDGSLEGEMAADGSLRYVSGFSRSKSPATDRMLARNSAIEAPRPCAAAVAQFLMDGRAWDTSVLKSGLVSMSLLGGP
jgi:hypothetical protein